MATVKRKSAKLDSVVRNLQSLEYDAEARAKGLKYIVEQYDEVLDDETKKELQNSIKRSELDLKTYKALGEKVYVQWSAAWEEEGRPHHY